ncbi:hypothetical protein AM1_4911 [Acaryochloris marina MBIC11017]|uniref:Uncharacterized protein n=1 Tax=Acaryochloris marina (strain MBIC 11017) TaxID=329726 RepID=B0C4J9_ACAM1|nr:hypothetical protein AM1_4911 [Acaryochloris marina MBIC11017]
MEHWLFEPFCNCSKAFDSKNLQRFTIVKLFCCHHPLKKFAHV